MASELHVGILSSPGMEHILPALVLGNHMATFPNTTVTVLVITTSTSHGVVIPGPNLARVVELPPVNVDSRKMTSTATKITELQMVADMAIPKIRSAIWSMRKNRPVALVVDLFCSPGLSIANDFDMSKYVYVNASARATSLCTNWSVFANKAKRKQEETSGNAGKRIKGEDETMLLEYEKLIIDVLFQKCTDGILINTWEALEPTSLKALRESRRLKIASHVPVYPVGPLTRPVEENPPQCKISGWLSKQPAKSVIYVSLESDGILPFQQMIELAWGLELSQQRFIWVVPSMGSSSERNMDYLTKAFLNRTKELGIVISSTVQQVEILNYPSIGGFLSDCGWNSILESIKSGVPMIAWPLDVEQKANATVLVEELCVAVQPEVLPAKKMVGREEIEKMVREVMQNGGAMREKLKELKFSSEMALRERGSSLVSMADVLEEMKFKSRYESTWALF